MNPKQLQAKLEFEREDAIAREHINAKWKNYNHASNKVGNSSVLSNNSYIFWNINWELAEHIVNVHNLSLGFEG